MYSSKPTKRQVFCKERQLTWKRKLKKVEKWDDMEYATGKMRLKPAQSQRKHRCGIDVRWYAIVHAISCYIAAASSITSLKSHAYKNHSFGEGENECPTVDAWIKIDWCLSFCKCICHLHVLVTTKRVVVEATLLAGIHDSSSTRQGKEHNANASYSYSHRIMALSATTNLTTISRRATK